MRSWPRALVHCDADAFYVSCEVLRRPDLKERPLVVMGKLGGIVLSKSYDLKKKGVTTGMPIWEAKKKAPDLMALPADFEWYNDISFRLVEVLKSWTPSVEVYSVDEAFLDIQGFRRLYKKDYGAIAFEIKEDIKKRIGITVSMGVSVTKTLAKMASELKKPDGVTVVSWKEIPSFLLHRPIEEVPGIGVNSQALLSKFQIKTCVDFVNLQEISVRKLMHRPGVDLWKELQGIPVFRIDTHLPPNKMITRTSSFAPLSSDEHFLWAHTVRQLERALQALHEDEQLTQEIVLFLRDKAFRNFAWSFRISSPTKHFPVLLDVLRILWREHFPRNVVFRSSGVSLLRLSKDRGMQMSLFEDPGIILRRNALEMSKEKIRNRYGNLSLRSASSLFLKILGPSTKKLFKAKAFNVEW